MYRSKEWKERTNWKAKKSFRKQNWWKRKYEVKNKSMILFKPPMEKSYTKCSERWEKNREMKIKT